MKNITIQKLAKKAIDKNSHTEKGIIIVNNKKYNIKIDISLDEIYDDNIQVPKSYHILRANVNDNGVLEIIHHHGTTLHHVVNIEKHLRDKFKEVITFSYPDKSYRILHIKISSAYKADDIVKSLFNYYNIFGR